MLRHLQFPSTYPSCRHNGGFTHTYLWNYSNKSECPNTNSKLRSFELQNKCIDDVLIFQNWVNSLTVPFDIVNHQSIPKEGIHLLRHVIRLDNAHGLLVFVVLHRRDHPEPGLLNPNQIYRLFLLEGEINFITHIEAYIKHSTKIEKDKKTSATKI